MPIEVMLVTSSSIQEVMQKCLMSGKNLLFGLAFHIHPTFNDIKVNLPSHFATRLPLNLPLTLCLHISSIGQGRVGEGFSEGLIDYQTISKLLQSQLYTFI